MEQESGWDKPRRLVVTLPNGTTKTIGISQGSSKRYWFGICPISFKIGNLKMCGGCQVVGYVGKEEQVRSRVGILLDTFFLIFSTIFLQTQDWPTHKKLCTILKSLREQNLYGDKAVQFLQEKLKRNLSQYELDIANHPRMCCVTDKANPPGKLKNCKNCFCVAFFEEHAEEARTQHDKWCKALRTAAEDYKNEQTIGHQVLANILNRSYMIPRK